MTDAQTELCESILYEETTTNAAIFLCGHAGSGKTFAAKWFGKHTPLFYGGSTSNRFCRMRRITLPIKKRRDWRKLLADYIAFYNETQTPDLYQIMIDGGCQIIDGIRRRTELASARLAAIDKGMKPYVLWITRPKNPLDPTCEVGPEHCDETLFNPGNKDFIRELKDFCDAIHLPVTPGWDQ